MENKDYSKLWSTLWECSHCKLRWWTPPSVKPSRCPHWASLHHADADDYTVVKITMQVLNYPRA